MKRGFGIAGLCAVLFALGCLCSCGQRHGSGDVRDGVRIVSGASASAMTRVGYESDGGVHRVVWEEGDALRVAAFCDGVRVADNGRLWSLFNMDDSQPFDKEYMLFAGDALLPDGFAAPVTERLYAVYPAEVMGDGTDRLEFPAIQTYEEGSFCTDAVIMFSAPVEAELPVEGTVHTKAFSFAHHTGYLELTPKGLPDVIQSENVAEVSLRAVDGRAVAGSFVVGIDDASGSWSLVPDADGTVSDCVTVDYNGCGVTVGSLGACRFSLLPGDYGDVEFMIITESGAEVVMPRSGLVVKSGVLSRQDINFKEGDSFALPVYMTLTGDDLGLSSVFSGEKTGEKDGIVYGYNKLKRKSADDGMHIVFRSKGDGCLWNETAFAGRIDCVEIVGGGLSVAFGTSPDNCTAEVEATVDAGTYKFAAPADDAYCYVRISNNDYVNDVEVASIRITCMADAM